MTHENYWRQVECQHLGIDPPYTLRVSDDGLKALYESLHHHRIIFDLTLWGETPNPWILSFRTETDLNAARIMQ